MQTDELICGLVDWVNRGWIRSLDLAFVKFLMTEAPDAPGEVLMAAALASHQLGRGHICLDLKAALDDPNAVLSLPPDGEETPAGSPLEMLPGMTLAGWEKSLSSSSLVTGGVGNTPLVLSSSRVYLRRYWQYMRQVVQGILYRIADSDASPGPLTGSLPDNLKDRLDMLFQSIRSDKEKAGTDVHWQSVGAAIAANSAFTVISGGPGTGKTTTVVRLLALLQNLAMEQGRILRICLAAPTGKAAARLTESIGGAFEKLPAEMRNRLPVKATTLHRLLGGRPDSRRFVHHAQNPLHVDLVVVDEASMIDLEMMASLLDALPPHARLVLLGDKDQLASVEAGSVLGDICAHADKDRYLPSTIAWLGKYTGFDVTAHAGNGTKLDQQIVVLRTSHRFGEKSGIGKLAEAVNSGDPERAAGIWRRGFGDIARLNIRSPDDENFSRLVLEGNPAGFSGADGSNSPAGYRAYLEIVRTGPPRNSGAEDDWMRHVLASFGRFQLIAAIRKGRWGVDGLNEKTAAILRRAGLIRTTEGWYAGRPVMITRNDYRLGLMNGDVGIVLPVAADTGSAQKLMRVVFLMPDNTLKKVLPSRLSDVETVYAMTVHKSQGSEFQHTAMVLPDAMNPVLTRELVYTGITRARDWFTMICPSPVVLEQAVQRRTHRASGLGELLTRQSGDFRQ
jgi:exodeoxyribonuclease V alpha subunit